jgi:phosphonate transport system ATP-binding protein
MTVIVTLHQVELALGWATRIVGLRDGRVVLDRDATTLKQEDAMEVYQRVDKSLDPDVSRQPDASGVTQRAVQVAP